jgi:hypothetical protein
MKQHKAARANELHDPPQQFRRIGLEAKHITADRSIERAIEFNSR